MKSTKSYTIHPKYLKNAQARRQAQTEGSASTPTPAPGASQGSTASTVRTTPRDFSNPIDYHHPYESMGRFAQALALRYDANRTCHAYYRQVRLIHEHLELDPAQITESQLRDYFLYVKLQKHWKPKSIRLALAAARQYFVDLLGHTDWKVFGQIRTKDHDELPAVLTRQQVRQLLAGIRLRRYRTPIKLIYVCGLRLRECLALTIHDIKGKENQLFIRNSKGHKDRVVPLPTSLYQELRRYWSFHRHPLLLFPNVGRGEHTPEAMAQRMREATAPMSCTALQRLLIVARKELNLPAATIHSLRKAST